VRERDGEEYLETKRKFLRRSKGRLFPGGENWGKITLLQDSQAVPAGPSNKDRVKIKTLGW
jgi:hypothetical protein